MIVAQVLLGFIAGLGGSWAANLVGRQWGLLLGPVLIILGLMWPGWVRIPLPAMFAPRMKRPTTIWGAFALGFVFSVAVCPVCTPALVILLGAAAAIIAAVWCLAVTRFLSGTSNPNRLRCLGRRMVGEP